MLVRMRRSRGPRDNDPVNTDRASFLVGELNRELSRYPDSQAQRNAASISEALDSGDLSKVNAAINAFMSQTVAREIYDKELGYILALAGHGDPAFGASDVPVAALPPAKRTDFEEAVRTGQMDAAAQILGLDQYIKLRAIARELSTALNR
jgi:hypothetical protein